MSLEDWENRTLGFLATASVALLATVILVAVTYFLAGPITNLSPERAKLLSELREKQDLWNEHRPDNFSYVIQRNCFCGSNLTRPYLVTHYAEGFKTQYIDVTTNHPVTYGEPPTDPVLVDDLFPITENALARAEQVKIAYHDEFGFPLFISFKFEAQTTDTHDGYEIRDFRVGGSE